MPNPLLEKNEEVASWESLYVWAIKNGKKSEFLRKFDEYTYVLNLRANQELEAYTVKRLGEMKYLFSYSDMAQVTKVAKVTNEKLNLASD